MACASNSLECCEWVLCLLCIIFSIQPSGGQIYSQPIAPPPPKKNRKLQFNSVETHPILSSSPIMSKEEVIHAYRHLYRAALRAVCYSKPASFVVRDQLRRAFRTRDAIFDGSAIRRTVWFLRNAGRERGLEHKIVRNILMTQFWRNKEPTATWKSIVESSDSKHKKQYVRRNHQVFRYNFE